MQETIDHVTHPCDCKHSAHGNTQCGVLATFRNADTGRKEKARCGCTGRRYINQTETAELVNLYHLALTALSGQRNVPTRSERLNWAAATFAKETGDVSIARAYKLLTAALA